MELLGVPTAIAPTLPVPELAVPSTASAESGPPSDAEASESVGLAHVDIELSSPDVAVVGRGPLPPLPRSPTATSLITLSKFDVSVHGVPLPLAAPIRDVWAVMAHPDNFLYILLTPKRLT